MAATAPTPTSGADERGPRVLMLGKGWFPAQLGGLDRYYRDLLEHLPEARGVVMGPAPDAPTRLTAVSTHDAPLLRRLVAFWRATQRAVDEADVIDAHFGLYALLPLWLGRSRKKPVVLHFQGPWADENVAAGDASRWRERARRALERAAYRRADRAIVLTSAFRQVLVERYGIAPWKVEVLAPGVDLERFTPGDRAAARDAFELDGEAFVLVAVRRLVPRMGLDVLLDAWVRVVGEVPPGSTLLIAGDGPARKALEQQVSLLGLTGSVQLLGRVSDNDLVDLYRAADLAAVPSLEHEGFGLVVLEAAACGTPSVVTEVGGLPEAVAALDLSLVVSPSDAEALADRLLRARDRDHRPDRQRTRAYAERFAWARVAARHREIARGTERPGRRDERMRVVYLDHVAQMSGGEIALLRLLPHLHEVDAHVILAEDGPLVARLHQAGISVEILQLAARTQALRKERVRRGGVPLRAVSDTVQYVLRLARHLHRLQPDLVHTNSLKAGVYGSLAGRLAGIPVVWHVRDRIAPDYLPRTAVRLVRWMSRTLAAEVIVNSKSTMATLDPGRSPVVVYSVLPEVIEPRPARQGNTSGAFRCGMVGRIAPWKGQDLFLRAFARAFPRGTEEAIVIGAALFGEDEYDDALRDIVSALGLDGRVEFRGFSTDIWEELAELDILVSASLTPEPFGQVILEGMAAGVPVVAPNAGGPAEILAHDDTGLLFVPGDEGSLAACLQQLRDDPERRIRLSQAARQGVKKYAPRTVAGDVHRLYKRALAGTQQRGGGAGRSFTPIRRRGQAAGR